MGSSRVLLTHRLEHASIHFSQASVQPSPHLRDQSVPHIINLPFLETNGVYV